MLDPIMRTGAFSSIPELYFDMFNEMGFGVNAQTGYLYDQDTGNFLTFENLYIKVSTNGQEIYAGRNEILFEPEKNYKLIDRLFGYFLDKCKNDEDGDILQGLVAYYTEDNEERKQKLSVKTLGRGEISSRFYWNVYLAFIEVVFAINGYLVDLTNFDVEPEFDKKTGRRIFKD